MYDKLEYILFSPQSAYDSITIVLPANYVARAQNSPAVFSRLFSNKNTENRIGTSDVYHSLLL